MPPKSHILSSSKWRGGLPRNGQRYLEELVCGNSGSHGRQGQPEFESADKNQDWVGYLHWKGPIWQHGALKSRQRVEFWGGFSG